MLTSMLTNSKKIIISLQSQRIDLEMVLLGVICLLIMKVFIMNRITTKLNKAKVLFLRMLMSKMIVSQTLMLRRIKTKELSYKIIMIKELIQWPHQTHNQRDKHTFLNNQNKLKYCKVKYSIKILPLKLQILVQMTKRRTQNILKTTNIHNRTNLFQSQMNLATLSK